MKLKSGNTKQLAATCLKTKSTANAMQYTCNWIPNHTIIEIVCTHYKVMPCEATDSTIRERRVINCQHQLVLALLAKTRLGVHQIAELLGYDIQRIYYARDKLRESHESEEINQHHQSILKQLKEYETRRLYKSYCDNSDMLHDIPEHDFMQLPAVCY